MAYFTEHGLALTLIRKLRRMRRKWFNRMLSLKLKIPGGTSIDPSVQILGLKHITIGRSFRAGAHLKLEALTRYGDQTFSPRIVIKDNVEIHDFVHIGATNYVEIGNNVLMASKIYISDHNHGFYAGDQQSDPEQPPARRPIDAVQVQVGRALGRDVPPEVLAVADRAEQLSAVPRELALQPRGARGLEVQQLAADGVLQLERDGMQERSRRGDAAAYAAVGTVAHHRVPDGREVHADLVGTAGLEAALER